MAIGIGSLVGAGLGLVGNLVGGAMSANEMRHARQRYNDYLNKEEDENQNWYDRRYNEDATQRSDALRLVNKTAQQIRDRVKRDAGVQSVAGGTTEGAIAAKEANNQLMSDVTGQIAADASARKDAIEGQYKERKAALREARATADYNAGVQQSPSIAQTANALGSAMSSLGSAVDDYVDDWRKKKNAVQDAAETAKSATE